MSVSLEDLASFDAQLADRLTRLPAEYLPLVGGGAPLPITASGPATAVNVVCMQFEEAAREAADEVTRPRPEGEALQDIQILLRSDANPLQIRDLRVSPLSPLRCAVCTLPLPPPQSEHMARLVKVPGIVIQASGVRAKATRITIQCRSCRTFLSNLPVKPGLEGYSLPRKCTTEQAGRPKCPIDPFFIVPDKCKCVDFQVSPTPLPPALSPLPLMHVMECLVCRF